MPAPTVKVVCDKIIDMLQYHSRVADEPYYMTWDNIYDIMEKAWAYDYPNTRISLQFPTRQQFSKYITHNNTILRKKVKIEYSSESPCHKRVITAYAFNHGGVS